MDLTLFKLVKKFLAKHDYHVNHEELKLQLLGHPSYPSLHSITGLLEHFDIEHIPAEVPIDKETLRQLPHNFLTLVDENDKGNTYALATYNAQSVELFLGDKTKKVSVRDFIGSWSGIVLAVDENPTKSLPAKVGYKRLSQLLYLVLGAVFCIIFFSFDPNLFQTLHFILSLLGVVLSIVIVNHELGFKSRITEKICNAAKTTSCENIFNSKGASLTKNIKLSDLGLIYFVGLAVAWIASMGLGVSDVPIAFLSLMALPITLYSIYYQYRVVKKWCPLCLGIVAVLWLQAWSLLFGAQVVGDILLDSKAILGILASFALATSWLLLKPLLVNKKELEKIQLEHQRFKRNFKLFNALYSEKDHLDTTIDDAGNEILLGSKDASVNLVLVTNPLCRHCKLAHAEAERLLQKHPDDINLRIRFNVYLKKTDSIGYRVALRLMELYNTVTLKKCIESLNEAYSDNADLKMWLSKWKEAHDDSSYRNVLQLQNEWCQNNAINFTPAFYVNGREWPKEYEREDLSYFIEDLLEESEAEKNRERRAVAVAH